MKGPYHWSAIAEISRNCIIGILNSLRFFKQERWHYATFDLPLSRTMQPERQSQFAGTLFNRKAHPAGSLSAHAWGEPVPRAREAPKKLAQKDLVFWSAIDSKKESLG